MLVSSLEGESLSGFFATRSLAPANSGTSEDPDTIWATARRALRLLFVMENGARRRSGLEDGGDDERLEAAVPVARAQARSFPHRVRDAGDRPHPQGRGLRLRLHRHGAFRLLLRNGEERGALL